MAEKPSLPPEHAVDSLPRRAKAAFSAYCIGLNPEPPDAARTAQTILAYYASGFGGEPGTRLIDFLKDSVAESRRLKEERGHASGKYGHYAADTAHFSYDVPVHATLSALEAVRFNPFQSMNSVVAALRANAIASCHGDPSGAVAMEIESTAQATNPKFVRAFRYARQVAREGESDDPYFPSDFLNQIEGVDISEDDGLYQEDIPAYTEPQRTVSPETTSAVVSDAPTQPPTPRTSFDYQVFLSFKNLDTNGQRTEDAALAQELYDYLVSRDFKVFYSNVSLEQMGVSQFQKAIDDALDSSQILIAIGTTTEHLESTQVRYEWEGFSMTFCRGLNPIPLK